MLPFCQEPSANIDKLLSTSQHQLCLSLSPAWELDLSSLAWGRVSLEVSEERPRWVRPGWSCTEAHTAGQLARRTPALALDLRAGHLAEDLRGNLRMVDIEVVLPSLVNLNIIKR